MSAADSANCLNPEPFAFESAFSVQRLIVAQINQAAGIKNPSDAYSGVLTYDVAPWFDWGPYLWASGPNASQSTGLFWCDTTTDHGRYPQCSTDVGDFRYGDPTPGYSEYWGDHTHPTYTAQAKVAGQLVKFIQGHLPQPQTFLYDFVQNWIGK